MTKLLSKLPKNNGLDFIAPDLLHDPLQEHMMLVVVDCARITRDVDTEDSEPTARILNIELVAPYHREEFEKMMAAAIRRRNGGLSIFDFGLAETEVGIVDTKTGEIVGTGEVANPQAGERLDRKRQAAGERDDDVVYS